MARNKSKYTDLSSQDKRNTDTDGANFRKNILFKTRFEFSKLKNCNFSACSAKFACFIRADLTGSNFTGANLKHANFSGATLVNVNFTSSNIEAANFEGAIIDGAIFTNSNYKQAHKLNLPTENEKENLDVEIESCSANKT